MSALLPREGQPFQQLGVWVLLWRRGVSLVQLRYNVIKFRSLIADAGQRELRLGLGEPHGGSRTAALDISAGWVPAAVSILPRSHQYRVAYTHRMFASTLRGLSLSWTE
jgi:hypothetical protein